MSKDNDGGQSLPSSGSFEPQGDQPKAIQALVSGIRAGMKHQTLLGVTGSGKTYTMAKVVEAVQKPTLVLAHNKTWQRSSAVNFGSFSPQCSALLRELL